MRARWSLGGQSCLCQKNKCIFQSVITEDRKQCLFLHVSRLASRSQFTAFNYFYDHNLRQLKITSNFTENPLTDPLRTANLWNNTPESYGLLLYLLLMSSVARVCSTNFLLTCHASLISVENYEEKSSFNSCLNLLFFNVFDSLSIIFVSWLSSAWKFKFFSYSIR